jgi:GntR family carbon starvation induced transcriptional regulator
VNVPSADEVSGSNGSPRTVHETVYERLKDDILHGRLYGRLRFSPLQTRYEASVGPLREALSRLEAEGLIETEKHKWLRVPQITCADFEDLLAIRIMIEQQCVVNSIKNGDDEWAAALVASYHMLELATKKENPDLDLVNRRKRHDNFHLCVVSACSSPRLLWIRGVLRSQAERYLNVAFAQPLGNDQRMLSRHSQILKAAIERRADDAAALIETDFRSAARHTIPRIRELEAIVPS